MKFMEITTVHITNHMKPIILKRRVIVKTGGTYSYHTVLKGENA
jgi:hypothetical protein